MAESKFNFYNVYKNYYKDVRDIKNFNIFLEPTYELIIVANYFMETMSKIYKIRLFLYVINELIVDSKIDYNICKSLKKKNKIKINIKTVLKCKNKNFKLYFLFKF